MRKLVSFLYAGVFLFVDCHSDSLCSVDMDETKTFITYDTIPATRDSVSKEPVATYTSTKGDKLTVTIYETKQTFQFLMMMKYKVLDEPDTLRIPNFGMRPEIVIKKGDDGQSCIVGFLDQNKECKEYKMVSVASGNLKLKVLKRYYTGVYKTTFGDTAKKK